MKEFYFIIILIALVCILVIWLLTTFQYVKSQFYIVKDVLDVFQIVISIFIAYLLYDRFGTSKKLLDKQNELIIEFLEELKKVRLSIYEKSEKGITSLIHINVGKNLEFATSKSVSKKIALFNSYQFYTELKSINQIIEHPLFPIDLKVATDIFKFRVMTNILENPIENYGLISFTHELPTNQELWMYPYDGEMKVEDYLKNIENIVDKIEKWINKETSIKIKLNLD